MSVNMGLGELGDKNLTFVQDSRFNLYSENLKGDWIESIKEIDYLNKTIEFSAYQVIINNTNPVMDWIDFIQNTDGKKYLLLDLYNGCGEIIESYKFNNILLTSIKSNYNYYLSNANKISISVKFDNFERLNSKISKNVWKIEFDDNSYEVKIKDRPNIKIDEIEISRLNTTCIIPGKYTWEKLVITYDSDHVYNKFYKLITNKHKLNNLDLKLYKNSNCLECWTLSGVIVVNLDVKMNSITLMYDGVEYKSFCTPNSQA